jgi:IPT/TIG domain
MRGGAVSSWGSNSTLAAGIVAIMGSGGVIPEAGAAQPAPTSTTTPPTETPIVNVLGYQALWFIGVLALLVALLWAIPLIYDTREANRWRRQHQVALLDKMIDKARTLSVEEIRQIVSAIDTQPRGTQGLTQSLLGLIIATFVGVAMIATLVSTAADSSDLRKTIVTALLSILGVIAGFYFGARTAQTAAEQATRPPESRPTRPDTTGGGGAGPSVSSIDPTTGQPGQRLVLTGSGFTDALAVMFGNERAEPTDVSDQEITTMIPQGTGTVDVTVVTPAGKSEASGATRFMYAAEATDLPESLPPEADATGSGAAGGAEEI